MQVAQAIPEVKFDRVPMRAEAIKTPHTKRRTLCEARVRETVTTSTRSLAATRRRAITTLPEGREVDRWILLDSLSRRKRPKGP